MSWRLVLVIVYGALYILGISSFSFSWEFRQALTSTGVLCVLVVALSWVVGVAVHWRRPRRPRSWRRGVWKGGTVWIVSLVMFFVLLDYWDRQWRPWLSREAAFDQANDDAWLLVLLLGGSTLVLGAVMLAALVDGLHERWHAARYRRRPA